MTSPFPLADAQSASEWRDSGQRVDKVTRAILISAEEELGYPLSMIQGGGKPRTSYSGTTHCEWGVADLPAYDWENKCRVLNSLGCYAYHRPYQQGLWTEHIHFGVIDHPFRDPMLAQQQDDWLQNPPLDGLVGTNVYRDGPHTAGKKIVFKYDPKTELEVRPMSPREKILDNLVVAVHKIGDAAALMEDTPVNRGQIDNLKGVTREVRDVIKVVKSKM